MLSDKNTTLDDILKKKHFTTREILESDFIDFPPKPLKITRLYDEPVVILSSNRLRDNYYKIKLIARNHKKIFTLIKKVNAKDFSKPKKSITELKKVITDPLNKFKLNPSPFNLHHIFIFISCCLIILTMLAIALPFMVMFFILLIFKHGFGILKAVTCAGFVFPFKNTPNMIVIPKSNYEPENESIFTTLSHENIHLLQICQNQERLLLDNLKVQTDEILESKQNEKDMAKFRYLSKSVEIEAYLHEHVVNLYNEIGVLASSKFEFLLSALFNFKLKLFLREDIKDLLIDFCMENLNTKNRKYFNKLEGVKNNPENILPAIPVLFFAHERRKIEYITKDLPERYAMLIELYGDKELADSMRSEPDIEYIENQGFVFADKKQISEAMQAC